MATLPGGKLIGLTHEFILDPSDPLFPGVEGYFWYKTPNIAINPPPFGPGYGNLVMDLDQAPVPQSREEVTPYVGVVFAEPGQKYYWPGHWLATFEPPDEWGDDHWACFRRFLESDRVLDFLDWCVLKCQEQSRAAQASVLPDYQENPRNQAETELEHDVERRCLVLSRFLVNQLPTGFFSPELGTCGPLPEEFHGFIGQVAESANGLLAECDGRLWSVWHVRGLAHRALAEWKDAERCFREALRRAPHASRSWIELSTCLNALGRFGEAGEAAQRGIRRSRLIQPGGYGPN